MFKNKIKKMAKTVSCVRRTSIHMGSIMEIAILLETIEDLIDLYGKDIKLIMSSSKFVEASQVIKGAAKAFSSIKCVLNLI